MKYFSLILLLWIGVSCNQAGSPKPADDKPVTDSIQPVETEAGNVPDTTLLNVSSRILLALKTKDYPALSSYVDPVLGLRFSPYAYIDSTNKVFSKEEISLFPGKQKMRWGYMDGEDNTPILKTVDEYFDRFVYDVDFLHAEKKAVNHFLGGGNSLNNLKDFYPACNFTEFYFSGFDPKYDGMDWRTLRLVFKTENGKPYLVAIVHDQWTI